MKILNNKTISLSIFIFSMLMSGCTSSKTVALTDTEIINEGYVEYENYVEPNSDGIGIVKDSEVDARIAQAEKLAMETNQIDPNFHVEDPSWTTKLVLDPDAFTADQYVPKPPVISYKHKFEKVFRDKPMWRTAKEFD